MEDLYQGVPRTWKMISSDEQKAQLSVINPNYNFIAGYDDNCVNCVIAYDLRQRGYDVIAKTHYECDVRRKPKELWKDIEAIDYKTVDSAISSIETGLDARYFLGIKYSHMAGHAVVVEVKNKAICIIDPQVGKIFQVADVEKILAYPCIMWRIDHLEVTQTGYNACSGGGRYDI